MPIIIDSQWANETGTADAGLTIPVPSNQANDLLIYFIMGDTGAPTWTMPSGYTQLFARNNTVSTQCAYKISGGSEPTTITVGSTVNETYNGVCISIRDIDTTNPFGATPVFNDSTQASAAKYSMSTITTNVANSLVLYLAASSTAGVPSLLEGPVFGLLGADGAAESMGVGWGFKGSTGTTSTVTCSNVTGAAGVKATIQIAAPSGGATIIPPYCSADNCTYLEPIHGVTAYNTNTALAATADTNWGTSIGGFTTVDATVAAAADVGINSFHSMGQLTSAASGTTTSGAELVFAAGNRPDVTDKNILCHVQVSTPLQLQRLGTVSSNKGVWFGMRSGASTNYKIWQVLGSDSPGSANRPIPIIINEDATNTVGSAGTLSPSSILSMGFWTNGSAVGAAVTQFGSMWLMDSTVIAGGNSTYPVGISGIVSSIARGKERLSAIQQGDNQMLLLQDLQVGDGGTSSAYLDLNATAIEFPSQRNTATKQVSYNSVDNKIGITYYAGASDTIKHRNSVISSPSRYKWGLHASSSTSASYDFSGLAVIGAGTISLARAITVTGLLITDYSTLDVTSADLASCSISEVPASNDTVTSNASTSFTSCNINVSAVTSGNRWLSVADPSIFTSCSFIGGGGHAMRITTPGTYTFSGNTFTSFGSTGSNGAAIYNDSGGAVTINVTGGVASPTYRNGASASTTVNNNITITLTGLKNPSEVRVFEAGTQTEVSGTGAESVTSGVHAFSVAASTSLDISILSLGYQNMRILAYSSASSASVPVSQVLDRQYLNP